MKTVLVVLFTINILIALIYFINNDNLDRAIFHLCIAILLAMMSDRKTEGL